MLAANPVGDGALVNLERFGSLGLCAEVRDKVLEDVVHDDPLYANTHIISYEQSPLQEYEPTHNNIGMELKDRLKAARKHAKLSQVELAKRAGVDQTTISNLERGKHRGTSHAISIATILGVSPRWLATGAGEMLDYAGERGDEIVFHDTELVDGDAPLAHDEIELPCFREVEFAAGDGQTQVIENHGASMRFSLARLSRAGVQPDQAACATLSGTSMEPTIASGSPIGIDKSTTHIIDGKIYALDHGGMLRVKRLYKLPLGRIRIVSDNADEYPEEVYSIGNPDSPRIIGRVFWWEVFD